MIQRLEKKDEEEGMSEWETGESHERRETQEDARRGGEESDNHLNDYNDHLNGYEGDNYGGRDERVKN